MNLTPSEKELEHAQKRIVSFFTKYRKGFVLGISGGLDSAVCAVLARRATPDVTALFLPQAGMTPSNDEDDSRALCESIGVAYERMDVSDVTESLRQKMETTEAARINIAPRVRMTLLYGYAQSHGALVVGTSNRTELLLGYFTKYGDGGSDLCPLGGLYKTQVRSLARHLGLPRVFLDKVPSANLYPGQTDEGELGAPYETVDAILYNHFDKKRDARSIARRLKISPDTVAAIFERVSLTRHKRRLPPYPRFS